MQSADETNVKVAGSLQLARRAITPGAVEQLRLIRDFFFTSIVRCGFLEDTSVTREELS